MTATTIDARVDLAPQPAAHRGDRGAILRQLRHDRRTIAMMLVVPSAAARPALPAVEGPADAAGPAGLFDRIGLTMLGIFPFVMMFLVTSIAMLRERTSGTLERLLTTPLAQAGPAVRLRHRVRPGRRRCRRLVTVTVATTVLGLDVAGSVWLVVLIAVVDAVLGVALGLLASAFARTEFQAVQFMPVVVLPQFFLCGLLVPRDQMAGWLQAISDVLPLTYAVEALQEVGALADGDRHHVARHRRSSPAPRCSPWRWRPRPCAGGPS